MKNLTVLIDMDEVLADFVGGACRIHGTTKAELFKVQEPGSWDISRPLGTIIRREMSDVDFWNPINTAGEDFWSGLERLSGAIHVLDLVKSITPDWYIVSAPSHCHTSHVGKIKWLKKQFGEEFNRFVLTPHKHLFAKPGVVLIDDREENVRKFIRAGGEALVYPTIGNSLHGYRDDPVGYLAMSLGTPLGANREQV